MNYTWTELVSTQPNVTPLGASLVMGVSVEVARRELSFLGRLGSKRPTWLQLGATFPDVVVQDAAVIMGVDVDVAKRELGHAHKLMRRMKRAKELTGDSMAFRKTGVHRIACKIVDIPLRMVKVSHAMPDASSTKEFRDKPENSNLHLHRGGGTLRDKLDDDAVNLLPSIETMVDSNVVGRKSAGLDRNGKPVVGVQHNPGCLELLPKSLTQRVQAMSLDDRIDVGDLSLTKGDMGAMTTMQRELAARRNAVEAKAA